MLLVGSRWSKRQVLQPQDAPKQYLRKSPTHGWKIFFHSPLGIPHGPGVLELSKKSKSYFRAGGKVSATWAFIV